MTLTGGSFFSGAIDGLGIAASLAGFDILYHVEYDDWRRKVLEKHAWLWPNSVQHKDITQLTADQLQPVDVLFGGFPCQDVSTANTTSRAGLAEGTRSGLWHHFGRLIGDLRPRAVVLENTPGLLSLGGTQVVEDLRNLGYLGRSGIISAADVDAPHLRERVFIVAYSKQVRHNRRWKRNHGNQELGRGNQTQRRSHPIETERRRKSRLSDDDALTRTAQPRLGGRIDGFTPRLDGFEGFPAYRGEPQHPFEPPRVTVGKKVNDRARRIAAQGDAVVWQAAYAIFYYLHQVLETTNL